MRSISVLLPTYQAARFLERVLAGLAAQRCSLPWDMLVVDCGSTDGTLEIFSRWRPRFPAPLRVIPIHRSQFDHGDTRNLLAAESAGDLLVYVVDDAIPTSEGWLEQLASNFRDPLVAAAYSRNVPRPDASAVARVQTADDIGYAPGRREVRLPPPEALARMDRNELRALYNYHDVGSALRREIWKRHPYPRCEFGEDVVLARALLHAGYTVVYDDRAVLAHTHDYEPEQVRARAEIDARFNAEWLDRVCVPTRTSARRLARQGAERDRAALRAEGLQGPELAAAGRRALALRRASMRGLFEGGRSPRRFAPTRVLEREHLHVLYVVHGFPPDTWAGTEVYTLELAREVQRLGHRVTVLARAPAERAVEQGGPPEFSLHEGRFQDLRVLRMVHRIDHQSLRESYAHPRAEQVFREVVLRERPDVVHFQHLLHFSARLPAIARELGLPSVVTCNDYWGLCARVQLIRPDGVRCERNQGLGCLVCVKDKDPARIPRARALYPLATPAMRVAQRLARKRLPSAKLERWLAPSLQRGRWRLTRWGAGWEDMAARHGAVLAGYAAADLLIAPSRFLREKYLATGRFDPRRFVHSDYGMRADHVRALEKRPDPEGRVRFGFVGSLLWFKGLDVLVRAMNRLAGTRAVLHVHGVFAPEREPHHAALRDLATAGNVVFHGPFDNQRLAEVYAELDVLVVPSVWFENSPLTIHEAFLLRTPVVTSGIGGMAELVRDGVDGLHFRVGDDADLARVLRRFLEEPGLAERLSGGFPRVKSIEEDAREMEFRYRGLACVQR